MEFSKSRINKIEYIWEIIFDGVIQGLWDLCILSHINWSNVNDHWCLVRICTGVLQNSTVSHLGGRGTVGFHLEIISNVIMVNQLWNFYCKISCNHIKYHQSLNWWFYFNPQLILTYKKKINGKKKRQIVARKLAWQNSRSKLDIT